MANRTYLKPLIEGLLRHLTPEEQEIPGASLFGNSRIAEAIKYLNGALQEISKLGPSWPSEGDFGVTINAPSTETVSIVEGERTAVASPWVGGDIWQDWYIGCTCVVVGNPTENQIVGWNPITETITFKNPFVTTNDQVLVTIYHDSIIVDDEVSEVLRPVFLQDFGELAPIGGSAPAIYRVNTSAGDEDFEYHKRGVAGSTSINLQRTGNLGIPAYYFVQTGQTYGRGHQLRIRVTPVPCEATTLSYRGRLKNRHTVQEVLDFPRGPTTLSVSGIGPTVGDLRLLPEDYALFNDPPNPVLIGSPEGEFVEGGFTYSTLTAGILRFDPSYFIGPGTGVLFTGEYENVYYQAITDSSSWRYPTQVRFPDDLIESVLIPYAEQRMKASPYWRNREASEEIYRQFLEAKNILQVGKPQEHSPLRLRPRF